LTTVAPKRDVRDVFAQKLSHRIGEDRFRRYFGDRDAIEFGEGRVRVLAGSAFEAEVLSRRFGNAMREAARAGGSDGSDVEYEVRVRTATAPLPRTEATAAPTLAPPEERRPARRPRSTSSLRHSFEDFVVGSSNRLAHGATLRLAEEGAGCPLSPLFIHGACGTGKTHLIQSLAKKVKALRPGARVRYTTGEAFTNAFISAVRENRIAAFHAEHRKLDLLCIDDVHFLASKTATQAELLHTLDSLALGGSAIAMASDEHPSAFASFSRELVSRFVAGMVVGVDAPDPELRYELVTSFAARRGIMLDRAGAELIASRTGGAVRDLEGAVVRVEAVARLLENHRGGTVSRSTIRQALHLGASSGPARPARAELIIEACADRLGVDVADVLGRSRHRRVVAARSIAAILSRKLTTLSYPELAVKLGRPNHSSVVTACQRLQRRIDAGERLPLTPGEPGILYSDLVGEIETAIASRTR